MLTFPSLVYPSGEHLIPVAVLAVDEAGNYVPAIPLNLITGINQGDGSNRLRVDAAQSSFFDKREFVLSSELNIPASNKQLFRFVATDDFIVEELTLVIDNGSVRMTTYNAGTPTGTFSNLTPVAANTMSEGPTPPSPRHERGDHGGRAVCRANGRIADRRIAGSHGQCVQPGVYDRGDRGQL